MELANLADAEAFTTLDGSTIREIAGRVALPAQHQSLAEATVPVGAATIAHLHRTSEELYFFTTGTGRLRIGDEERDVRPGDCAVIPPGVEHKLVNTGDEPLVLLCCCAPAYSHEDTVLTEGPSWMPRDDPADNGGLFIGRRPGSAPLKYRTQPERLGTRRQRLDGAMAAVVLLALVVVAASCWGPQPLAWLWIASQASVSTGLFIAIIVAFFGLLASVMGTLWIAVRLDGLWRILRRAAGHDQKDGVLGTIFLWTALLFGGGFLFWLFVIAGPGSTVMPKS